jgi:hypothetical protein
MISMVNFLKDIKAFLVELIGFIGGLIWAYNRDWDYEPVILIIISGLGLLIFVLLKIFQKNIIIPRVELEMLYTGGFRSDPKIGSNSPKTEEGYYLIEKGGKYIFIIKWNYELIIRNNSIQNAYNVNVRISKSDLNLVFKNKHNSLDPIIIDKPIIIKLSYEIFKEMDHYEAEKLLSDKYPQEIRNTSFLIEYQDEYRENQIYCLFSPPKQNRIISKKDIKLLDYVEI